MTHPTNYAYHSTGQFRQVIKNVQQSARFKGFDSEGNPIIDPLALAPTIEYTGTVKLHGTNASILIHEDGTISFHSKSQLLGYVKEGEFTLLSDNAEFAQSVSRRMASVLKIRLRAKHLVSELYGEVVYPIKISGEWCGQGIQKGVGISYLPKKSLFIFGIKVGETDQKIKRGWLPVCLTTQLVDEQSEKEGIYSIANFPTLKVDIDFNNPLNSQNFLVEATESAEKVCPVSAQLKLVNSDGEPQTLGEGYVWAPSLIEHCWDSGNWFKTKGEKHSVTKVKTLASVDTEKLNSIAEFVEYAVTENRLQQGLTEVGLDQKLMGQFIGWVSKDINKEEGDTLESNNLTMKDVGSQIANKARAWYITKL